MHALVYFTKMFRVRLDMAVVMSTKLRSQTLPLSQVQHSMDD
jgi:hypothetical protein